MENLIFGIITVAACLLGYYFSFKNFKKNEFKIAIGLLMLCGFLLRIYVGADFFLHDWDERFHALVAKNLMEHPFLPTLYENPVLPYNYRDWTAAHIWVHKQPIPLWSMSLSMAIFGVNEIALRLPSIIISTLGIAVTFQIGQYLFNKRVAFIAAFLYSIHGLIIELAGGRVATDHTDLFFLFFVELAVLMAIRFAQSKKITYNILCGVSIGIAILCKWLPGLIVVPIWGLLLLDTRKFTIKEIIGYGLGLCVIIFVVVAPWQIYIRNTFIVETIWENEFNVRHIFEPLANQTGPFYYHFDKMRMMYGELIYIPLIWFLWKSIKRWKNYRRAILVIWVMIPFLFFSLVKTKMQGYTLFAAPGLFIITGLFWEYLFFYKKVLKYKWVTYSFLVLLIAFPVRYSIERVKPFMLRDRTPQWTVELRALKEESQKNKIVLFNAERPIQAMFYSDIVAAYDIIPSTKEINRLLKKGYVVYINDRGGLRESIKQMKGIKIIKLSS
jgi:4-amino-4-deoxy-L-arabinose transferase-like glycosyltransferase